MDLQPVDLLITHALLISMDSQGTILPDGSLAISAGKIVARGLTEQLEQTYSPQRKMSAEGMLVIPGIINSHTHGADVLFRGLVEDLPLEQWLQKLWIAESEFIRPDTVELGSTLAYAEMVRGGITTAVDMFWFPEAMVQAARQVGFRLMTGPVYFDSAFTDGIPIEERTERARQFLQEYQEDPLIIPCLQPHAIYTVSPVYLEQASDLARQFGVFFITHASETETEVRNSIQQFGVTPVKHLDRLGLLGERTLLAHCVHLDEDEFELLQNRGTVVAHCPVSNIKIASGIADVGRMLEHGVKVTLGTDGPVSGNDLNPWLTIRLATMLQKVSHNNPALLPAEKVMRMATIDAARALGLGDKLGSLEVGKQADLVLIKTNQLHSTPYYDPYAALVYSIGREDVDTVLINGQIVLERGRFVNLDEATLIARTADLGLQIGQFMQARLGNLAEAQQKGD